MTTDMENLARVWRAMEDKKAVITQTANEQIAAIQVQQDAVGSLMLATMLSMKQTKSMTAAGMIEVKQAMKVSAADWAAVYRFIMEDQNRFAMLHKRLSSTFVEEWAEAHTDEKGNRTLPPGVNVFQETKVVVKRVKDKSLPKEEVLAS